MDATSRDSAAGAGGGIGTNIISPRSYTELSSPTSQAEAVNITIPIPIPMPPAPNTQPPPPNASTTTTCAVCPSSEIAKSSSSPNNNLPILPGAEPVPGLTRRRTFNKSKPKSRFGEPSLPIDSDTLGTLCGFPRSDLGSNFHSSARSSGLSSRMNNGRTVSFARKTPRSNSGRKLEGEAAKDGIGNGPDEREVYRRITAQLSARKQLRMTVKLLVELCVFLCILGGLVASFVSDRMRRILVFGLKVWKWFVLLMVIFSGMLITHWVVHVIVFFIEWKFLLKKNVVYFTHGLKTSVEIFLWICVVLCTWVLLFEPDVDDDKSHGVRRFLDFVTWTIVSLLIGSFLWLIKTTLLKVMASSFHLNRFFDRIQESIFHHYVLQTLSGRPIMDFARRIRRCPSVGGKVSFREQVKSHMEIKVVDIAKVHQLKKDKVPSYTMQLLVDVVSNSGLTTLSGMLAEDVVEGGVELDDDEITSVEHAIATAVRIFENIVQFKDESDYIDKNDLLMFMIEEEVDLFFNLFEANENGQISLRAFSAWVVKVFKDRVQLQHALNDNNTAIKQLNKLVTSVLIVIVFVIWLLLTEIATTRLLFFFLSQLVLVVFVFGNTCKTIFEAIIFVFVVHPFDVGDRCLVDGTMMIVEEMNILTTVFLKVDKEKVYYPNAVLATKPIGNYYRSPDNQGDQVELDIHFMTPVAKIGQLKHGIKNYLLANPHYWHPDHSVVVREIDNVNKVKMALFISHTMNFQDFPEKSRRKSELILEIKRIFEELDIKYHLLPQEVILNNIGPTMMMMNPSST